MNEKNKLSIPELAAMVKVAADISFLQERVHESAVRKGWWPDVPCRVKATPEMNPLGVDVDSVGAKIALCHAELSEALECVRDGEFVAYIDPETGKPEGAVVELADTVIRIMDLCGALGLDLEEAIRAKVQFNTSRPFRHGGKKL